MSFHISLNVSCDWKMVDLRVLASSKGNRCIKMETSNSLLPCALIIIALLIGIMFCVLIRSRNFKQVVKHFHILFNIGIAI
mmetsp:Transcript_10073/g.15192  ORF Transcript_10073/g.15192 Transcript_10073/m.15192 type:complete len:81 (+) Transcript_10073:257-499(+)